MPFIQVPEEDVDNMERLFALRPDVDDATAITQADVQELRGHGLSDAEFRDALTVGRPIETE